PVVESPIGIHNVTLKVTDTEGLTDTDTVVVSVYPAVVENIAPTADAGADQTVTDSDNSGEESITLDGSASTDSDGTVVSYYWTISGTEIGTEAVLTTAFAVGQHEVTLTVTDNNGVSASDTVSVTVLAGQIEETPTENPTETP